MKHAPEKQIMITAANYVANKYGRDLDEKKDELIMPDNPNDRTINWYASVLDRACVDFFVCADDDKLIEVLQDARKNGFCIKEYSSIPIKRFYTCNIFVRKAILNWKSGKVKVRLYTNFGSIVISKKIKKTIGDVKHSKNLEKVIDAIQGTLIEIEKLL